MNILSLNISDLGGLSYNLCNAINKNTNHIARSIVDRRTFTYKPFMLKRKGSKNFLKLLRRWVNNADVIHINEKWQCVKSYGLTAERCRGKTIIYHVHAKGPMGCLLGSIVSLILVVALVIFAIFGMITFTLAVWIGFSVLLFAVVAALLRRRH